MGLRATDIFTPGAFPAHSYVERKAEKLEESLRNALETAGQLVSIVGPSKSGKTVLTEYVVGRENLITVTGAGIENTDEIWQRVLDWMGAPSSHETVSSTSGRVGGEIAGEGSAKIPFVASGSVSAKATGEVEHAREHSRTHERGGLTQVVREIATSDFVVLIDDFHYMPRTVQEEVAKVLKEAVRLGVKICVAAVRHRGDDVVRANPELRGRVGTVDLSYWKKDELRQIALAGFNALRAELPDVAIDRMVEEAAGSPQLMQQICLTTCFKLGIREESVDRIFPTLSVEDLQAIFEQTSTTTDFRSLVEVLDAGPKTRGIERKLYEFRDKTEGDVYRCILKAVASNPPSLSFNYEELLKRIEEVCANDSPVGSSITGTCWQMSKLAQEKFPNERAIDWDEQKQILDIPDPYLLFYLRWSGWLVAPN